jgi:hypothetical protein
MAEKKSIPLSPAAKAYQEAMARLSAGDLGAAVRPMLDIHEQYPDSEEALFVEEQLARARRMWPSEAEKAGLTTDAWNALRERAAKRRAGIKPPPAAMGVIALVIAAAAWSLLAALAPRIAFLGKMESLPLIFRIVAAVVGAMSLVTGLGLMKMKWEAVNAFIVLAPIFMIVTFIGMTEASDMAGKILCGAALAAEIAASYWMSKQSHRFIY